LEDEEEGFEGEGFEGEDIDGEGTFAEGGVIPDVMPGRICSSFFTVSISS